MTVRRHTYPELLQRLVVAVLGGVAGETHPYPTAGDVSVLERGPATAIVGVHGARDGQPHRFAADVDFRLSADGRSLEWLQGDRPDEGTLVSVDYTPHGAISPVTDVAVGSVLRTLLETIAMESAALSAQLDAVHQSGFVDTATGRSLERVVELLGITRVTSGHAAGEVALQRAQGSVGLITIPAGTKVATADGAIAYETTEEATLLPGQAVLRVPVRDPEEANGPVPADSLVVLPAPIAGIAAVTNPAPTALAGRDEDDEALRRRAKRFLHGSERATLGALQQAVAAQGVSADIVEDPTAPGIVHVTPHAAALTPEVRLQLERALLDARPAGVVVHLADAQPPRLVHVALRVTTADGLLAADRRAVQHQARDAIAAYFETLAVRATASISRLLTLVGALPGVTDVQVVSAVSTAADGSDGRDVLDPTAGVLQIAGEPTVLGDLDIADPALPTRIAVLVTHATTADPVNVPALQAALDQAVAALNAIASDPAAAEDLRTLGYARLRTLLPLPDQPAPPTLAAIDDGSVATTDGSASPYRVRFVVTQETGLVVTLAAADDSYGLTAFERLTRDAVDVVEEEPVG